MTAISRLPGPLLAATRRRHRLRGDGRGADAGPRRRPAPGLRPGSGRHPPHHRGAIAQAQATLAKDPDNGPALGSLASSALDKARQTGDPTWNTTATRPPSGAWRSTPATSTRWT